MGGGREGERRQRRGAGVSLCVVVEVVVVVWRWCGGGGGGVHTQTFHCWLAGPVSAVPRTHSYNQPGLAASLRTPSRRQQRQSSNMA